MRALVLAATAAVAAAAAAAAAGQEPCVLVAFEDADPSRPATRVLAFASRHGHPVLPLTVRGEEGAARGDTCHPGQTNTGSGTGDGVVDCSAEPQPPRRHHSVDSLSALRDALTTVVADPRQFTCSPTHVLFLDAHALLVDPSADDWPRALAAAKLGDGGDGGDGGAEVVLAEQRSSQLYGDVEMGAMLLKVSPWTLQFIGAVVERADAAASAMSAPSAFHDLWWYGGTGGSGGGGGGSGGSGGSGGGGDGGGSSGEEEGTLAVLERDEIRRRVALVAPHELARSGLPGMPRSSERHCNPAVRERAPPVVVLPRGEVSPTLRTAMATSGPGGDPVRAAVAGLIESTARVCTDEGQGQGQGQQQGGNSQRAARKERGARSTSTATDPAALEEAAKREHETAEKVTETRELLELLPLSLALAPMAGVGALVSTGAGAFLCTDRVAEGESMNVTRYGERALAWMRSSVPDPSESRGLALALEAVARARAGAGAGAGQGMGAGAGQGQELGAVEDTVAMWREAIAIRERTLVRAAPGSERAAHQLELAAAMVGLSMALRGLQHVGVDKTAEAELFLRKQLRLRESILPSHHPDVTVGMVALAEFLEDGGRLTEGMALRRVSECASGWACT